MSSPKEEVGASFRELCSPLGASPEDDISLLELLIVVARSWRLIRTLSLGMTIVGLFLAMLLPSKYTATTSILPPQTLPSTSSFMSQLGSVNPVASLAGGGLGLKNPNDTQVALLRSRVVEDAMVDRFHLAQRYNTNGVSNTRVELEKMVEIDSGSKDGLIKLSVTDRDPRVAAEMANGYVGEFKKFSATLAVSEASQRRLFFEQQLLKAKDDLASSEENLKKTEQKTGLVQLDSQSRAIIESVAQLHAQIAAKEVEIRSMRSFAAEGNSDLFRAEQELAGLRAEEGKMGAASNGDSDSLLIPKGVMQEAGLEYVRKLRDVKYFETIFDMLARQYEAAKVDEARQGALVQVVDPAVPPDKRSSPKRTLIVLGSAVFGILAGILWAFIRAGITRIHNNPAEQGRLELLKQALREGRS